jgi:hypothetical protein
LRPGACHLTSTDSASGEYAGDTAQLSPCARCQLQR